ncbi:hypothetical protein [uncultured Roseibium sp.]|uniref:hypothetical protein n=1 Tax=uncultured Roseibium sp. TaxID=1936171 RepID=UPI00261DEF14|nr:hypothetical protein [uncultured Roseibium sp.]
MNSFFVQDPSVRADRPDIEMPPARQPRPGRRLARYLTATAMFFGTTLAVAVLLFVPVLAFNLSRVEALEVAGEYMPVTVFMDELGALFWGTAIIALAFTSFMTGLLFMSAGATIRPRSTPIGREDALMHLTVLRLSRSER